jgi:chemotaxis protein methyltransferase CheR
MAGDVPMRPEEFRLLRDLIRTRTGLAFGPEAHASVERRLRERLTVLGLATFTEYHQYLRYAPGAAAEWDEVVEQLTTHETYFFRENHQLRAFQSEVLPLLAAQARGKRLALWSAGCSTGEEVYTIAALVRDSGLFEGWDVRVFGSDISRRCIAAARRAVYGPSSFRSTSPQLRARHFVDVVGGSSPNEALRAMCHFGQLNLLEADKTLLVGRMDAIFCRNVLIYLDPHGRRRVIDALYERLQPGGVLLLGHAESLLNVSTAFELLHLRDDLVYRRPDTGVLPR